MTREVDSDDCYDEAFESAHDDTGDIVDDELCGQSAIENAEDSPRQGAGSFPLFALQRRAYNGSRSARGRASERAAVDRLLCLARGC
jgi:hypothetical protein